MSDARWALPSGPGRGPRTSGKRVAKAVTFGRGRQVVRSLVRTLAPVVATVLLVSAGAASAQTKVVVEQFQGPGADRFRQLVVGALGKQADVDLVSDKKLAATEADLGLIQASDAYDAVAKQLKANGFVGGKIAGGKKPKATLTVRGADGKVVGSASWTGANTNKLMTAISANVGPKLKGLVGGLGGGGGGGAADAIAELEKAEKPKKREAEEAPPAAAKKRDAEEAAEPAPAKAAKAARAEEPAEKEEKNEEKAEAREELAAAPVEERADEEPRVRSRARRGGRGDAATGGGGMVLDVAAGAKFFGRQFDYNERLIDDSRPPLQKYDLPLAMTPAVHLAVDFFPIQYVGLTGSFEYAKAAFSEVPSTGDKFDTKYLAYMIGAKPQYVFGSLALQGLVAFANQTFEIIIPEPRRSTDPQIPGVQYRHVKAGLGARLQATRAVAVFAGANYMYMLGLGEIEEKEYFPYAAAAGGEGFAGVSVALPFLEGLEARAVGDFKRIVFNMNSDKGDRRIAGGAVDQYLGFGIQLAYRNGL